MPYLAIDNPFVISAKGQIDSYNLVVLLKVSPYSTMAILHTSKTSTRTRVHAEETGIAFTVFGPLQSIVRAP